MCFQVHPLCTNTLTYPVNYHLVPLYCFLRSPCSSSRCSSGVTPRILIFLMKCLKPPCGNPSTPIRRTLVLWLLRRQGHTLSHSSPSPSGHSPPAHCCHLLNFLLSRSNSSLSTCCQTLISTVLTLVFCFTLQDWRDRLHRWLEESHNCVILNHIHTIWLSAMAVLRETRLRGYCQEPVTHSTIPKLTETTHSYTHIYGRTDTFNSVYVRTLNWLFP